MRRTGHPGIRTECSHSLRGCGDLCRRCLRSGATRAQQLGAIRDRRSLRTAVFGVLYRAGDGRVLLLRHNH